MCLTGSSAVGAGCGGSTPNALTYHSPAPATPPSLGASLDNKSYAPCCDAMPSPPDTSPSTRPDQLRPVCQGRQFCARSDVAPCSACRKHDVRARGPRTRIAPSAARPSGSPECGRVMRRSPGALLAAGAQGACTAHAAGRPARVAAAVLVHAMRRSPATPWRTCAAAVSVRPAPRER